MDLFETGGELVAIRRREAMNMKDKVEKRGLLKQIENMAESKWKARILELIQSLAPCKQSFSSS